MMVVAGFKTPNFILAVSTGKKHDRAPGCGIIRSNHDSGKTIVLADLGLTCGTCSRLANVSATILARRVDTEVVRHILAALQGADNVIHAPRAHVKSLLVA